jgi:Cu/Ag efflux pump CusA
MAELAPNRPARAVARMDHTSQVTIVPFYDRTGLIQETLGTLNKALIEQALVTILVVLVMVCICAAHCSSAECCRSRCSWHSSP